MFAAVTAIPVAFLDVVVIVADAVTLVLFNSTIGCLELRVQTFAFEAVSKLLRIAIVTTAVASVPATSAAVVVVVAEFIALVFWRTARAFALQGLMVLFVETFALVTVSELTTVTVFTAVAAIVLTFRHIVHIIAETVRNVRVKTLGTLMLGVFAHAFVTVFRVHVFAVFDTAVTAIPVASVHVVGVIAIIVTLVIW